MIFITNYYIGYMCGIFTFFYFLYYYSLKRDELIYKGEKKISFSKPTASAHLCVLPSLL